MARWGRRLAFWARQNRVGLWAVLFVLLAALAYAVTLLTESARRYGPGGYEPKDLERQRYLEKKEPGR